MLIQVIFTEPCRIMRLLLYVKNPLNIGIDPIQNGQLAAVLDF